MISFNLFEYKINLSSDFVSHIQRIKIFLLFCRNFGRGNFKDILPVMVMVKRLNVLSSTTTILRPTGGSNKMYIIWVTSLRMPQKVFYTLLTFSGQGFHKMNMGEVLDIRSPQDRNLFKQEVFCLTESEVMALTSKQSNIVSMKLTIH